MNKYTLLIGIDVGVNTGIAFYNPETKHLLSVRSMKIHQAMDEVKKAFATHNRALKIYCEDARQRTWFGNSGREKLQGAGSVKRDSSIWEDFLSDYGIDFEMIPPRRNTTKLNSKQFEDITKYKTKTNEHGRDAAMLVFNK